MVGGGGGVRGMVAAVEITAQEPRSQVSPPGDPGQNHSSSQAFVSGSKCRSWAPLVIPGGGGVRSMHFLNAVGGQPGRSPQT